MNKRFKQLMKEKQEDEMREYLLDKYMEEAEDYAYETVYRKGFFKEIIDVFKKSKDYNKVKEEYLNKKLEEVGLLNKEEVRR